MSVTLRDIAREAGVSVGAVSQVLGDNPTSRIATDTRQRILSVANQMGYRGNLHAKALSTGKSLLIGVLTDNLHVEICLAKTLAISKLLHSKGYRDLLRNTDSNEDMELETIDEYLASKVEGVVLTQHISKRAREALRLVIDLGIPVIALESMSGLSVDCVTIDRKHGGYIATKHLVDNGHTQIGLVHADLGMAVISERLQGYREALTENSIQPDNSLLLQMEDGSMYQSGYKAAKVLMGRCPKMTAIFCHNDAVAVGAMRAVSEAGLRIPDDMAIVGFDDIASSGYGAIPLTTVAQPVQELARRATDLLFRRIESGSLLATQEIRLRPSLVVRNSTVSRIRDVQPLVR